MKHLWGACSEEWGTMKAQPLLKTVKWKSDNTKEKVSKQGKEYCNEGCPESYTV